LIGVSYTFGRDPESDKVFKKPKKEKEEDEHVEKEKVPFINVQIGGGKNGSNKVPLEQLNAMLKILELQMKLFEMQYLKSGGSPENIPELPTTSPGN
jgi:hypothetical protein